MVCGFCKDLEFLKSIESKELEYDYEIAIVSRTYREGTHRGTITHKSRKFKFCPECGKKKESD